MPIEGSLREFELGDILQLLHLARKTGELRVVREPMGSGGAVLFSGGAVVGADIEGQTPRLAYMLYNAGKISELDLHRAERSHAEHSELTWAEIFESLGVLEAKDLERYLKFHVEESVYEMLGWEVGRFSFGERPLKGTDSVTWLPVESLLMEGARRADELSVLAAGVDSPNAVPRLAETAATDGGILSLTPAEWEILGRVDGVSDVKAIAWVLGRSEFDVSKVVSKMAEQGLLEIVSEAVEPVPRSVASDRLEPSLTGEDLDAAREQIETMLKANPRDSRAHFLAARMLERAGRLKRAVTSYERALKLDPQLDEARQRLGLVRLKGGDLDGAARDWTAYLRTALDTAERRRVERAMTAVRELQAIVDEFDGWEHA